MPLIMHCLCPSQFFSLTIWRGKPTPGMRLMNLRFRDEMRCTETPQRTGVEGPGLSTGQRLALGAVMVGGRYGACWPLAFPCRALGNGSALRGRGGVCCILGAPLFARSLEQAATYWLASTLSLQAPRLPRLCSMDATAQYCGCPAVERRGRR